MTRHLVRPAGEPRGPEKFRPRPQASWWTMATEHYRCSRILEPQHYPEPSGGSGAVTQESDRVIVLHDGNGNPINRYQIAAKLDQRSDPCAVLHEL